ncbi:hypothetical protein ACFQ02_05105 [Seminibacterium arietis]|uniref:Uncharacterized protein n=1 Tax=Seminibacterium arietis TaxID=1173502 RepID=A0ABW3IA18_9PAST
MPLSLAPQALSIGLPAATRSKALKFDDLGFKATNFPVAQHHSRIDRLANIRSCSLNN